SKVTGWVHGDYLSKASTSKPGPEKPEEEKAYKKIKVTTPILNVRERPTISSMRIFQVYEGQVYTTVDEKDGWYKIDTSKVTGWISGDYVKVIEEIEAEEPKEPENPEEPEEEIEEPVEVLEKVRIEKDRQNSTFVNVSLKITASSVGSENVEYQYLVRRNSGEWKVIKDYTDNNSYTYIPTNRGDYTFRVKGRIKDTQKEVVSNDINHEVVGNIIYENINYSRSFQDMLLEQLSKNPQTDLYTNGWMTANVQDLDRYLNPENFLQTSNDSYTYDIVGQLRVTTNVLNVREKATTSSNIVDKVLEGEVYTIVDEKNGWYKIQTKYALGWIHGGYVKTSYKAKEESLTKMEVTASVLNVRESGTTNSSVIDQVLKGQTYTPIEEKNGWYKIKTSKVTGWVHGGYLKKATSNTVSRGETGNYYSIRVDTPVLNVRSNPSVEGTLLTQVKSNEIYIVLDELDGWYKIKSNGITGWVSGDYTKSSNQAPKEMYQFLVLSGNSGLSANQLNNILKGKGILEGKGQAFIDASKKYNVNEIYLISHVLLETGNGKSSLATGRTVNGKTVYNMYGIGAYDHDPIGTGSQYAYNQEWFTPENAIIGGAKFISQRYVNNSSYKQDTLYKMRWNPDTPGTHQYATDIGWAYKQTAKIKELYDLCTDYTLRFEIPKYSVE
ncbi:SH3 domain-containing protein, partial [Clostridium sp. D2Q-14]|uniref:SH3 domain-containing protein n=1 Tax=Anaeromonas gelatinilytica TaxID=2683194 RepID=UPI00193C4064